MVQFYSRGIVVEVGAEPAFDFGDGHALALVVVGDLVAVDLAEGEVARLGVGEVEAADAGAGPHGEGLGDLHAGVGLDVEQAPDGSLLGVVGAGGVAGGGADAAILFVDEFFGGEVFAEAVAPLVADAFVQAFGEGFGEAVGDGLGHDGVVVVVVGAEAVAEFLEADAAGDGEGADVSGRPVSFGAMKSASERQGSLPSRLACWRRKWKRSSTLVRVASV